MNKLLPDVADNNYLGSKVAVIGLYPILLLYFFRSIVHFTFDDAGLVVIGNIIELPMIDNIDPNNLVYMFASLWGASQLLISILFVVIFFKYRSLLSVLWLIVILDIIFRWTTGTLHPLTPEYYISIPPGKAGNLPMILYALVMFYFSMKRTT